MKNKVLSWLAIGLTVVLLALLKWLHLGVTHYNWFLIILLSWTMILILWFRWMEVEKHGEGD